MEVPDAVPHHLLSQGLPNSTEPVVKTQSPDRAPLAYGGRPSAGSESSSHFSVSPSTSPSTTPRQSVDSCHGQLPEGPPRRVQEHRAPAGAAPVLSPDLPADYVGQQADRTSPTREADLTRLQQMASHHAAHSRPESPPDSVYPQHMPQQPRAEASQPKPNQASSPEETTDELAPWVPPDSFEDGEYPPSLSDQQPRGILKKPVRHGVATERS